MRIFLRKFASVSRTLILAALLALVGLFLTPFLETDAVEPEPQPSRSETLAWLAGDVYLDGHYICNGELEKPLLTGEDGTVYIPLSPVMLQAFGFTAEEAEGGLLLRAAGGPREGAADPYVFGHCASDDSSASTDPMYVLQITGGAAAQTDRVDPDGVLFAPSGTAYVSLRALADCGASGVTFYKEEATGLYISTDPQVHAVAYCSDENKAFVLAAAAYMQSACYREQLSLEKALEYEELFRQASRRYGVSEILLMAVCKAESSFWNNDVSGAGACGLMQIMPGSAAGYGISREQLFDPETNIFFGAMYIRDRLGYYKGDEVKALSAYNQGMGRVNSGVYSTAYANTVFRHRTSILRWLEEAGVPSEFQTQLWPTR